VPVEDARSRTIVSGVSGTLLATWARSEGPMRGIGAGCSGWRVAAATAGSAGGISLLLGSFGPWKIHVVLACSWGKFTLTSDRDPRMVRTST
jgi:hypothetical protein